MTIDKKLENDKLIVNVAGRLDTTTAPELEASLDESMEIAEELLLQFKDLEYISSAGLRVLLTAHKAMSKKGGMKVAGVNDVIMEIFEVTGFSGILTIEESAEVASPKPVEEASEEPAQEPEEDDVKDAK